MTWRVNQPLKRLTLCIWRSSMPDKCRLTRSSSPLRTRESLFLPSMRTENSLLDTHTPWKCHSMLRDSVSTISPTIKLSSSLTVSVTMKVQAIAQSMASISWNLNANARDTTLVRIAPSASRASLKTKCLVNAVKTVVVRLTGAKNIVKVTESASRRETSPDATVNLDLPQTV